jgi:endonuclease/exonuclease/phosphatase family metal-dependent hydrolase
MFAVTCVAAALVAAARTAGEPLRVMTFNVRYATADDGENRWPLRRELLLRVIHEFDPDILGVQEALREQMDVLRGALPEHASVGPGRDADGGGEYSAIFYRQSRFDLVTAETFWLSDTPAIPGSHTWGNELPRICTWVRLFDGGDGRRFSVFNTHWDHISQPARLASGKLMAERASALIAAGEPVIVTGDFNADPANPAIAALTRDGTLLADSFRQPQPEDNGVGTFHGFSGAAGPAKIDAVLVSSPWQVESAEIVRTHEGARYPSDHFPVTAVVSLPPPSSPHDADLRTGGRPD